MRRLLRLLGGGLLVAVFAGAAGAQSLGVKAGWSHPTLGGAAAEGWSALNTFAGGGTLTIGVEPRLAIEADLLYVQKGAHDPNQGESKMRLDYVEIPVLAKGMLPLASSPLKPSLSVGPYIGFETSCKATTPEGIAYKCSDVGKPARPVDLGLTVGAGVGFPLTKTVSAEIEARYDLGLRSIDDDANPADVKNRTFMLMAGISVPIGYRGKAEASRTR